MIIKVLIKFLLSLTLMLGIAGCGLFGINSGREQLPTVAPLAPPKLPDWIEQISPIGDAKPLNQIRIRFKEALIPVESLDSPEQQNLLQKFELTPPLPGRFRFLTPRMVGFQADKALPQATRFQVTLKSGLADLKKHRLDQDLAWTFNTEPIKLTNLPGVNPMEKADDQPIDLQPKLQFTSNVELDVNSVQKHLQLIPEGKTDGVGFKVILDKEDQPQESEDPLEKFDPSQRNWVYQLIPQLNLAQATHYRLSFAPGILPAYGNLASEKEFASKLVTYSPLAFQGINFYGQPDAGGTYGRFVKGSPQLEFNNILVPDSAIENIKIEPKPKEISRIIQVNDEDRIVNINPYALAPATSYTITVGANLKDKFGQTLGKPVSLKYDTGDLAGDIWVPSDLNIFPAGKDLQLNINTINLPEANYKAAYKVVQPTDLVYDNYASNLLPKPVEWQSFSLARKNNQEVDITVPLRERLSASTGMLAYGVQARTNKYQENGKELWREPTTYGLVQLTNLGVFSQWFPDSGLIRVHHLSDGSPVKAAAVEIYQSQLNTKSRAPVSPCVTGKTDDSGNLTIKREDLKQCLGSNPTFTKAPELLIIARENQDWAFTRTEEYSGVYGYGIDAGWQDGKPESRGVIFSDRQLYQPGEKAWLTGFADYLQNGTIQQDKNAAYQVTLVDPDGQNTNLGTKTTNEFGTFSLELPISKTQRLGYYTVQAKGKSGQEISGEFRVAEFKPPNFKVELNLDQEFALIGDKVEAKAASNYLFGAPVQGGEAKYFVTRQQANFVPKGWEEFSFGRQWFWPEESPTLTSDVLQTTSVLDANGKSAQSLTVAKDLPYPMTYQVDVQVADVSNLSVANSQTFTALPSNRLIGLKSNFVADAGKPFAIETIVTDPTGKPLTGQRLRLELQQMKYSSVTKLVEGSRTPKNQVEYKTVAKAEVSSASNPQSVTLTPKESGSYRIRANFSDTKDEISATDLQIWVTGDNQVYWGSPEEDKLEVKLDKKEFKPGETATALIQSPYPEAELYFAVIKDKPLYQQIIKVKGGAPQIQFQVTPEMLPNAAVQAVLVRQGKPLNQVEPGSLDKLVKIGFAPFKVNLQDKYLKVEVNPLQASLAPGAEETVQLELKDNQGNPTQGQVTVMVVNEAVLQLSGYRPPDLVNTVYAEQAIATRFSDNRPDVVIQPQDIPKPKGWGYGGGFSAGAANTRVRTDFQALAYYNGAVLTDATGKAQITFKLPDDLTTWRVMAVATDGNLRFGNGDRTFITTKPLLTNAILPQFARPGDRILAGLSVTNNTGNSGNLSINGELSGTVKFAENNPTTTNLQTPAETNTQAYRFPMLAENVGEGKVRFTTQLNNAADAFEVPLEIKPLEITEQVVETGITEKQTKIPLNVDKNTIPNAGGLDIQLASTLVPEITAPAKQVLGDDELPFAEPAASQLIIAANLQNISQKYGQTFAEFNSNQQANQATEQLQKLQVADGGFASYPGQEKSDPWVSSYAAESLAKANQAFPGVINSAMLSRLKGYLEKVLANPGQYDFCKQQICKTQLQLNALIALAELGDKRNSFLADIYQQRNNFDVVNQIKLARYLSQFPEWQDESQTMLNQLQKNIYETGRTAVISLPNSWGWMSSQTTAQAQALRLFIANKAKPEVVDKLFQSLLAQRRDGTWRTSYNNAQALTALVEYSQLQPTPPNFVSSVQLAGKKLGEHRFEGYSNPSLQLNVPMDKLPRGRHDLVLQKSGRGKLHYLVAYNYRLQGNQPGKFNGLRVSREIQKVGEAESLLQKFGLYAFDKPLTLQPGQVFDIGVELITDHPVDHVVITDPLPAGLEAVDASFQTTTAALQAKADSWQLGFKNIYRDRIIAYADHLEPGVYSLHYLVRSVTPGKFLWPGAEAHLQYAPEEFGRAAESTLIVEEQKS
ncbi:MULTISPECIES: alpha-2-macroglobulin family protein [unclassified Tolypothrix]|uniref:alpha-2-macroglobulin family protein n=1 Tax=unclassified Tolypothrix TaxID=2649714 RepID=UPI0005EAC475|nr:MULTISPECIES: alpha-2-macroglobulin [unclassified Tolypothrix]BAY94675.1 alpha-2-macroglobulin domain-containing protein [Microchaete diplosiphon NIES-3275]EKE99097.1 alpha-2-macroglobulin family region [Tolypothrix sp. PCC 7601]MBE9085116.1 alpha-2-macroglobulin family protein [Tolypothrix sp. LEGE 11397]UYD28368.1 alpha-2-macroglobulin family protein [Tolypothrix sp. PCC 7712]UYD35754.1 alpha-2-macroglobulin family protein [Tolypothrix sp. PCC 7601]